ncbi:importin-4-like [Gigantopelta aegis]|uniref:importin-4-like n=1 Tax=Gigantopelta aegis TaxID=1735272 RepID=UPI001B8883BA|nr:importin-4-like [Gigantopelta aegis]
MAASLEQILLKLLEPDNTVIQEATQQLKEFFKEPDALSALCQVLAASPTAQVRQYAAVLLRKKIHRVKQWNSLPNEVKQSIRENILQLFVDAREPTVSNALSQLIATIAKHDLPTNEWPQLFEFILTCTKDQDVAKRELGMSLLYTVTTVAGEQLKPHLVSVMTLLSEMLDDTQSKQVPYNAIRAMTELAFFIGDEEKKYIQDRIGRILEVIQPLLIQNEDKACEALGLFDELLESEVSILLPHIRTVVDFCLQVTANSDYGDAVRVKAMSIISTLVKLKKKSVLKQKLVDPILQVLFPVMCSIGEREKNLSEANDDEEETSTPCQYASQVIDVMALHLPPEKLIPPLMSMVETGLESGDAGPRRAAYMSMAVVAEGCADYLMNKHLNDILNCVCKGLRDSEPLVRNAALFALGQFSEHLQPDISKFASQLLPVLFQHLRQETHNADKNPHGLTKSYYALEMFCENLGKEILPFLPILMEHVLSILQTATTVRAKELAISAIGSTACAAKEDMMPYFPQIIELFKTYLNNDETEDMMQLKVQTIESLGLLARNIGVENFRPLANECIQLGLKLLDSTDDPDLRRCIFVMFAAISNVIKSDMGESLEKMINYILQSIKSMEGFTPYYKEKEAESVINEEEFKEEEEDIGDADDEEDDQVEGISVMNSYLDEKEDACAALGELAENTGAAFLPHLEKCYTEVVGLVTYPASNVKKAAITTLAQFCTSLHAFHAQTPSPDSETALKTMLVAIIPKYVSIIREDVDRTVVMAAVDALQDILNKIGMLVLQITEATDVILSVVKEIFTHKLACQDQDEEDEEEQQAEYDGMLIESGGDVLPVMARILGGDTFLPFFSSFITDLLKRLKQTSSTSEKSFAVGTLAETLEACGSASVVFVEQLYPVFLKMVHEEDEEVRSNAVFALGVLVSNSGEKLHSQYPVVLKVLFDILNKETDGRVQDNICAATCRLIWANKSAVPLEHVIPVIMKCLPLKQDLEEIATVYSTLIHLYGEGEKEMMKHVPQLLSSVAHILGTEHVKQDVQMLLIQFVQNIQRACPEVFQQVKSQLGPELGSKLDACIFILSGSPT